MDPGLARCFANAEIHIKDNKPDPTYKIELDSVGEECMIFYDLEVMQDQETVLLCCFMIIIVQLGVEVSRKMYEYVGLRCMNRFVAKLKQIQNHYRKIYLYGYNSNGYDHLFLLPMLTEWGYYDEETIFALNNNFKYCRYQFDKHQGSDHWIHFKDMMQFVDGTLASHAPKGMSKMTDKDIVLIDNHNYMDYVPYCVRDVEILVHTYFEFLDRMVPIIKAGFMYNAFQVNQFISKPQLAYQFCIWKVPHLFNIPFPVYEYGYKAYCGARVESQIFGMRMKHHIKAWDISSMYPAALNSPMPVGTMHTKKVLFRRWDKTFNPWAEKPFIATCRLRKKHEACTRERFGLLPLRLKTELLYVNSGDVTTVLTCIDLWNLIRDGWEVLRVKNFVYWDRWDKVHLNGFYNDWYNIKQSYPKDSPDYWLSKIMLNSSYGKFVQRPIDNENKKPSQIGWFCLSYTRCMLSYMKESFISSPILYYGDTDSVYVSAQAYDEFADKHPESFAIKKLGDYLNVKGTFDGELNDIIVLGKKMYSSDVESKRAAKGAVKKNVTLELLQGVLDGKEVSTIKRPAFFKKVKYEIVNHECHWDCSIKIGERKRRINVTVPRFHNKCKQCHLYRSNSIYNK